MKETNEQYAERMDKIEDLYACMKKLMKWGYKDLAFDLRIEADKLRLNWKRAN
jgi:hypothetical protein